MPVAVYISYYERINRRDLRFDGQCMGDELPGPIVLKPRGGEPTRFTS